MFNILDLFQVKENVNPNIQLLVDALRYYNEDAISGLAADVWDTARTIEDYTLFPAVIQNVLLSTLKYAIINHTVKANPDTEEGLLRSHLVREIGYSSHGATAALEIGGESLTNLEDIKCAVDEISKNPCPF